MAIMKKKTIIEAVGLNVETGDVDIRVACITSVGGVELTRDEQSGTIRAGRSVAREVTKINLDDAPPIEVSDVARLSSVVVLLREHGVASKAPPKFTGKRTFVNAITFGRDRTVSLRFRLAIYVDGEEPLNDDGRPKFAKWHRTTIEPGIAVDDVIAAVSADITTREALSGAPVDSECVPLVKAVCAYIQS